MDHRTFSEITDGPALTVAIDPGAGDSLTLHVSGELDMDTVDVLSHTLDRVFEYGFGRVTVDLSQLRFCDSSGIKALLFGAVEAERTGCRFAVVAPRPFVRRVFEITGVTELLGLGPAPES